MQDAKNPNDPSLYENARGWLKISTPQAKQPPLWIPVMCRPQFTCGRLDLVVTPLDGIGTQAVWITRVYFENEELNMCKNAPSPEDLDAYYEAKKRAARIGDGDFDGFISEEDLHGQAR